jgi:hypothetical protein
VSPDTYPVGFRLYRKLQRGEFFVGFGDTAQGGSDKNFSQFMSKDQMDIPLVFSMHGVAAEATPYIHQALEWIYQKTGVKPVFAFERQNGGSSEMHNLMMLNNQGHYRLYIAKTGGTTEGEEQTDKLGWDTNSVTRPKMLGDWKVAYETGLIRIYDQETLDHHQTFIVNPRNGKPEADSNQHDDGVMSCAGAYQLYQTENKMLEDYDEVTEYRTMTSFAV